MKQADNIVLMGRNPLVEALNEGKDIEKVFILDSLRGDIEKEIRGICKDQNIPLSRVPNEKLNALAGNRNHQGVVGMISPIHFQELDDVLSLAFEQGKSPAIVILEGVSDVRNMAAICRSALVFGMDAVVITAKKHAAINSDTIKISAGAILNIPVCREKNMNAVLEKCKMYGIQILATDLHGAVVIDACDFSGPVAIVMGAEDMGVTPETLKQADQKIKIPQISDFDSLNVSVAAGIIFYQLMRSRA
ncbi:MAG TPA: 23S rRNA (guanosine(2251)-2'-O)-methyltransferase RlmB [Saprospiraceae bacterium]|nr:23S rRNA (guanosine(2251)-2'-O)-methyltransferase RlmB [Saprospiraceae bacterium]HPN71528.1 23S rRNA (guanosine(2251)-2'-O)-methyltransferase RlmB [Saprospiraceae bacterium]